MKKNLETFFNWTKKSTTQSKPKQDILPLVATLGSKGEQQDAEEATEDTTEEVEAEPARTILGTFLHWMYLVGFMLFSTLKTDPANTDIYPDNNKVIAVHPEDSFLAQSPHRTHIP